ncbi:MAG: TGS domain-containing protein, partial [Deltaproteobacteria bacterium]|nr:TGS domain-containing protein [Deltaproteobacteria bacterium]
MKSIAITLPDGSKRTFEGSITAQQVAAGIGRRLEEAAVAAKLNGTVIDLTKTLESDCELAIITRDSKEGLEVIRHSTAHLLAQAIKELFPSAQITIGPVIEDGFFYDIDCPKQLTQEDLPIIEKKMAEIAGKKLDVHRQEIERNEAIKLFKGMNEHYKAELIEGLPQGEVVSAYKQGDFIDLCRGPHVPNTSRLGKFKLLSVAGAYWR